MPVNCRQRLAAEGKPYPRSSCASCGQFSPNWRECESMLSRPVPQSPATELVAAGLNLQQIVTEALIAMIAAVTNTSPPANEPPPPFIQAGIDRAVSRISAQLAPLQTEIERLTYEVNCAKGMANLTKSNLDEAKEDRDQLKARRDELEVALKFYADGDYLVLADHAQWDTCSGEPINWLHDDAGTASVEDGSLAKQALSKPAGSDSVEYGPTPGCKQCEEAESCRFTDCPECGAQLCEDVNGDGFRVDTTLPKPAESEQAKPRKIPSRTIKLSGCEFTEDDLLRRAVRAVGGSRRNTLPRWALVRDAFGCGSGVGTALCRRFGFDPEEILKS
ncbi:hypothetical protein ALP72_03599 [Pseudomonas coronafaciens pv. coronafaciens]|nr:hypothetical protein ALP72_03599 [Pseudomonas coronafaciens pv. coronafaciens]